MPASSATACKLDLAVASKPEKVCSNWAFSAWTCAADSIIPDAKSFAPSSSLRKPDIMASDNMPAFRMSEKFREASPASSTESEKSSTSPEASSAASAKSEIWSVASWAESAKSPAPSSAAWNALIAAASSSSTPVSSFSSFDTSAWASYKAPSSLWASMLLSPNLVLAFPHAPSSKETLER